VANNSLHASGHNGAILAASNSSGVVDTYYDRIALNVFSASSNERLGCYDDSSGPNAVLAETGSITSTNGYNFRSLTEFALTTTTVWLAMQTEAAQDLYYQSISRRFKVQAYGAFTTGGFSSDTNPMPNMKISHS